MRYWWVNQNQTFRHEIAGGYLWSPKRNKGNRLNPFYETMREVAPGDIVFSFVDTRLVATGVIHVPIAVARGIRLLLTALRVPDSSFRLGKVQAIRDCEALTNTTIPGFPQAT